MSRYTRPLIHINSPPGAKMTFSILRKITCQSMGFLFPFDILNCYPFAKRELYGNLTDRKSSLLISRYMEVYVQLCGHAFNLISI